MTDPRGTRFRFPIQIGTLAAVSLVTGVGLYVLGIFQVNQIQFINLSPAISGTGTTSAQVEYRAWARKDLTQTGGVATYSTLQYDFPETYTGSLTRFCIEVAVANNTGVNTDVDCGIVANAATGTGVSIFDNEALTKGLHCMVPSTTEITIGPDQDVRCAGLVGTGSGLDAEMYIEYNQTILN